MMADVRILYDVPVCELVYLGKYPANRVKNAEIVDTWLHEGLTYTSTGRRFDTSAQNVSTWVNHALFINRIAYVASGRAFARFGGHILSQYPDRVRREIKESLGVLGYDRFTPDDIGNYLKEYRTVGG